MGRALHPPTLLWSPHTSSWASPFRVGSLKRVRSSSASVHPSAKRGQFISPNDWFEMLAILMLGTRGR